MEESDIKAINRFEYLTRTFALILITAVAGSLTEISDYNVGWLYIIAPWFQFFWITRPRLVDIAENKIEAYISVNQCRGFWGLLLWLYAIVNSGSGVAIIMSQYGGDIVMETFGALVLCNVAFIPAHLYLLFKPGHEAQHIKDIKIKNEKIDPEKNDAYGIRLKKIKSLLDEGLISEDDYRAKKEQILSEI